MKRRSGWSAAVAVGVLGAGVLVVPGSVTSAAAGSGRAAGWGGSVPAVTVAGVLYTIVDLGTLGGESSWASAVNERGQVTGEADTKSGDEHAFLWDPVTGMTDLGTLGGDWSWATDLNDRGQVAGTSPTGKKWWREHAFLWDPVTGMTDLGTLGGAESRAVAVNGRGQVAGEAQTKSGALHAFLWDPVTGMQDLGALGGDSSEAADVNERGQVAGAAWTETSGKSGEWRAFLWDPVTGMTDLGTLGGAESRAVAVNERGQVAGEAQTKSGALHAFLWDPVAGMQDLGTVNESEWAYAPFGFGEVRAMNERGQVIGSAEASNGADRAFLSDPVVGMQDLGVLGDREISEAVAITSDGMVAGRSYSFDDHRYNERAFLWDPVAGMRGLGKLPNSGGSGASAMNDRGQVAGSSGGRAVLWTPSTLAPRVRVNVARTGAGNQLHVNVNPNRGPEFWRFRVQKRTRSGSWSRLPGTYRTQGKAETRTVTLGRGVFRVKVLARYGYKGTTSEAVRLSKPTVRVKVRAVSDASKMFMNVNPNRGSGSWTFRVQYRRSNGTWYTLPTTYKTFGPKETNTINLRKGTYRVKVKAQHGHKGTTSTSVRIVR